MIYEAVYYNGWTDPPAYYVLDAVEGDTPEQALADNLPVLTQQVRELFHLSDSICDDEWIQETIYVLSDHGLIGAEDLGEEDLAE
jgi:hypothetical protein